VEAVLDFCWDVLKRFARWLSALCSSAWKWLSVRFGRFLNALWQKVVAFGNWFGQVFLVRIRLVWQRLQALIEPFFVAVGEYISATWQKLSAWANSVWARLSAMADATSAWASEIWDWVSRLYDRLSGSSRK
jgi:hypothetical protein